MSSDGASSSHVFVGNKDLNKSAFYVQNALQQQEEDSVNSSVSEDEGGQEQYARPSSKQSTLLYNFAR